MHQASASILIVDDRPDKLLALEAVLDDLGPTIVRAYSGREALRHVLEHDFAVILLDVNMPGMDGFETASLIRQRKNSQHVPIIFVTSFGDEIHMARGYQLGAVDYILAPVNPAVLRSKVGVFVDLYIKTSLLKQQAEFLRQRASQLQKLAAASLAINGAASIEKMLQSITDSARDIVGSHQAITLFLLNVPPGKAQAKTQAVTSFSHQYLSWRSRGLDLDSIAATQIAQSPHPVRMSEQELRRHPDWETIRSADIPPIKGGILAAPLSRRTGSNLGFIYLAERVDGEFSNDDEAILVQLAQMASIAIENSLYAQEREANRVKDEFLATLSHELRTPLNAIVGWTQLLKMESPTGEMGHGLEVIERNARSQTKLIEDLLDVSRINSGKMRLNLRQTRLYCIVLAAADAVRPMLESKQIRFHADLQAPDVEMFADPDRLQQVFWNLLTNAAKFTSAGGSISIQLRFAPDSQEAVELIFRDTGAGIDPDFLPYIFDRFRQADSSSTRSHGGLGIGLTVVHHIVQLHGGSVRADSEGIGRGATFTVTLPVTARQAVGPNENGSAPEAASDRSIDLSGVHVLLVDDEADAREVQGEILRRAGARVTLAGSCEEALAALGVGPEDRPDILLSDIAMPVADGYALLTAVRRLPRESGGDMPAIALTAYARDEDRSRAVASGFHAHLVKPVAPAELTAAVAAIANKNRSDSIQAGNLDRPLNVLGMVDVPADAASVPRQVAVNESL